MSAVSIPPRRGVGRRHNLAQSAEDQNRREWQNNLSRVIYEAERASWEMVRSSPTEPDPSDQVAEWLEQVNNKNLLRLREGWEEWSTLLQDWLEAPESAYAPEDEEPGLPPTEEAIMTAGRLVTKMLQWNWKQPDCIVPSNRGGVSFYCDEPTGMRSLRIRPNGSVRFIWSDRGTIIRARVLDPEELNAEPVWEAYASSDE